MPADYGGVIDVFHKLRHLHISGFKIHLHCFEYGRKPHPDLLKYCASVEYYRRETGIHNTLVNIPYIVASRKSNRLLKNLHKNDFPILFEGLHSTYWITHPSLENRLKIVRTHNIEHEYYRELFRANKKSLNSAFYKMEAVKLRKYEQVLKHARLIAAISPADAEYFKGKYPGTVYLPAFHPCDKVVLHKGSGDYILYHGNLSVPENISAVELLIKNVFEKINLRVIIAGKDPARSLHQLIKNLPHVTIISNPDEETMNRLVAGAHLHLLTTGQETGIKIKLLTVLFNGRHCIVNHEMVNNTGLEKLCHICGNYQEMVQSIKSLMDIPFSSKDIEERRTILESGFSNDRNISLLTDLIINNC